ncbi:hypothetical protein ST47_g8651 [Ascochyta rabiei]|uniref:Uncharacterized protein n=1 Tax=Didymella rabiei TaxID=5454 RepID=A0A162YTA6_DIDRA|nr:hypothetical protein ST47_g8651 [Ascochyta rabiei]
MDDTAMNNFMPLIIEMMRNPPDPKMPLPLINHLGVAIGVSVPFLVGSQSIPWSGGFGLTCTGIELHCSWDDAFVTIAAIFNLIGQITFLGGIKNGIGQHLIYILDTLPETMKWFYVANAAYTSTTVCIKLALLCQYLRLFRKNYRRVITLTLLAVVILWGGSFTFMAWFPCFPISGFWNKTMSPPAKCYAFGYRTTVEAKSTLLAFAGSNMSLDFIIFLVPLTEYFQPNLKRRQVLAMTGLFVVGLIVVLMAVLRLWSGLKYNNRGVIMYDYTFWLPEVLAFSCLEVDFAIICASMPIFWPTVKTAWSQITVTREIIVTNELRFIDTDKHDLEANLERTTSIQSYESTEGLVNGENMEGKTFYHEPHPRPRALMIPPLEQTARMSWGGTILGN